MVHVHRYVLLVVVRAGAGIVIRFRPFLLGKGRPLVILGPRPEVVDWRLLEVLNTLRLVMGERADVVQLIEPKNVLLLELVLAAHSKRPRTHQLVL